MTRIAHSGVPDDVRQAAAARFTEPELVQLLVAITTNNVWNPLAVSTRPHPAGLDTESDAQPRNAHWSALTIGIVAGVGESEHSVARASISAQRRSACAADVWN